ncbi:MAG: SMC-Scp complex subunit ScpB [Spirochaetales bacterium]|nr:SMC-Scp complex subunit ScpB [Spirochaetales bacterium]
MSRQKEINILEIVLYLESEPVDVNRLVRITKLSKEAIEEALVEMKASYMSDEHGLELVEIGGGFSLSPKKEYWEVLKERYGRKNENRLSKAALETLSIIAYSQPITKAEIESIRGVNADSMMKVLQSRDLIKVVGKKDVPGKPVQYGTTKEFLTLFRLKSIADLPKLDELDSERFEEDE